MAPDPGAVPLPGGGADAVDYGDVDFGTVDLDTGGDAGAADYGAVDFGTVDFADDPAPPPAPPAPPPAPAPDPIGGDSMEFDPFGGIDLEGGGGADAPADDLSFDPTGGPPPAGDDLSFDPMAGPMPMGEGEDDLELDLGAAPAPAPAPVEDEGEGDLEILDFIDQEYETAQKGGAKVRAAGPTRYKVKRKSGKTFGPFEAEVVVSMLKEGQLLGNEEISGDDGSWRPIGSVPAFGQVIQALMEAPSAGRAPPSIPTVGETLEDDESGVAPKGQGYGVYGMAALRDARTVKKEKRQAVAAEVKKRWPIIAGGLLAVIVIGAGIFAGFTPYGWFFYKLIYTPGGSTDKPTAQLISDARAGIEVDTYASLDEAITGLQAALGDNDEDVEARALFCQVLFLLQWRYGEGGQHLTRALGYMRDLEATSTNYPEYLQARMLRGLLEGRAGDARAELERILAMAPDDVNTLFVLGLSYVETREFDKATVYLEKILSIDPKSARASHALGWVYTVQGTDESLELARKAFEEALASDPEHIASAIELAHLALSPEKPDLEVGARALDRCVGEPYAALAKREQARVDYLQGILKAQKGLVADARTAFAAGVAKDPKNAFGRTAFGRFLLSRGEPNAAVVELRAAHEAVPSDVGIAATHIEALIAAGKSLDATSAITVLAAQAPADPRLPFLQGLLAEGRDEDEEAEKKYRVALKMDPGFYRASLALGDLYLRQRRIREAEVPLRESIQARPDVPDTHVGLGRYLLAANRPKKAIDAFQEALEIDAESAAAHLGLAQAYAEIGEDAAAEREFGIVQRLEPEFLGFAFQFGTFLWNRGRLDEALGQMEAAYKLDAIDPTVQARLGAVLYDLGRIEEAGEHLQSAALKSIRVGETYYYLGLVFDKQGDRRTAIEKMLAAISIEEENPRFRFALGELYLADSDFDNALRAFQKATALDADYYEAWLKTGEVQSLLKRPVAAVKAYQKAIEIRPEETPIIVKIGDVYDDAGEAKKAISWYERATQATPPDPRAFYKLARAFDDTGDKKKAEKMFLKATKEEPDNAMPHYYLGYFYKDRRKKAEALKHFKAYMRIIGEQQTDYRKEVEDEIYYLSQ
ncbi:MAG: tetratricopeptide repeat protein [Deltaproteobacteria bacterium]|nr:tetratricopeptide repeat protein [Deltaproteobacteria bacterium]